MQHNTTAAALVADYAALTQKYLHEREIGDELLDLAIGSRGWRDCTRRVEHDDRLKPLSPIQFRRRIDGVDPMLFDYSWNHLDQTQYLHWSVYHIFTEWLLPPDADGFGAMNVGVQEVPPSGGPFHHGIIDAVFATWDDPRRYCDYALEGESGLLMRFWNYDRDLDAFTLRSEGPIAALLTEWKPTAGGGVEIWTTPLTRDPAFALDDVAFVDGDIATAMPHENEESSSWGMAIRDLGRRHSFDPAGYVPVWAFAPTERPDTGTAFDRFAIDVVSQDALAGLSPDEQASAYDALWQRYLGVKMLTDFTLRHAVHTLDELPPAIRKLYEDFPVVGRV